MGYQAHSGPGQVGYSQGEGGVNEAYFDSDQDDPFKHYKDNQYDKKDDNPLGGDYHKKEEEDSKKQENKEKTLADNVSEEESKISKKEEEHSNPLKKAAEELHRQNVNKDVPKKELKATDHKSIEDAIKEASDKKDEVFTLK